MIVIQAVNPVLVVHIALNVIIDTKCIIVDVMNHVHQEHINPETTVMIAVEIVKVVQAVLIATNVTMVLNFTKEVAFNIVLPELSYQVINALIAGKIAKHALISSIAVIALIILNCLTIHAIRNVQKEHLLVRIHVTIALLVVQNV